MANEQLKKFAEELKTAREEKGISIKDLHANTKIDVKFLEALENGNYSILPEVYIRAFIREFANEVDLDVEETLRKYELAKEGVNYGSQEEVKEEKTENLKGAETDEKNFGEEIHDAEQNSSEKKQNALFIYGGIGIAVLAIILIFVFSGNGEDEIIVENKYQTQTVKQEINIPQEPAHKEIKSTTEQNKAKINANEHTVKNNEIKNAIKQETEAAQQMPQVPVNPFSLKLMGTDTVWVRAQIDFDKTEEFMLYPEIGRTIQADRIVNLLIGNSGGIEIYIDGEKIDFTGEKGKVKNLILTKSGIEKP